MTTPQQPNLKDPLSLKDHWLKNYPANVKWDASLDLNRSLYSLFVESAQKFSDRPCLEFMGRRFTYHDIDLMVDRFARGLEDQGFGQGSKIGLSLPNSPFYVIAYFAALKIGATVVNFNPLYTEKQIQHQINDSGAEVMVTLNLKDMYSKIENQLGQSSLQKIITCNIGDMLPTAKGLAYKTLTTAKGLMNKPDGAARISKKAKGKVVAFTTLLKSKGVSKPAIIDPAQDIAVLQYTGGTTGTPKAAMLTHQNLVANIAQLKLWFDGAKQGEERILAVLPFFHVFAMTTEMNLGIALGAEIILHPRFEINATLKSITEQKPTIFCGVPTLYQALNQAVAKNPALDLSSLNYCISGGAPLPATVQAQFETLTACTLIEGYGLSETSPVASANPMTGLKKSGSIGLPLPQTEFKITKLDDPSQTAAIGEKGEICIKGPQVMKGYFNKAAETKAVMTEDGFFRTGDVGYMDADGFTVIVDRIKDMIIAGGYNVYPSKIEEAIRTHAAVAEVIVAGIKDDYRGETVKAFIVLKDGQKLTADELKAHLKTELSPIEMPKQFEFRDSLPKTMIGKPSRKDLVEEEALKAKARNAQAPTPTAPPKA